MMYFSDNVVTLLATTVCYFLFEINIFSCEHFMKLIIKIAEDKVN